MKKILITGANGMVGSALVQELVDSYDLVLVDKNINRIIEHGTRANVKILESDLHNLSNWTNELENVYCVIHLAAAVHWEPKNVQQEELFIKTNTEATTKLYDACSQLGVKRFLFFSTNDVYKATDDLIDEEFATEPKGVYGRSKLIAENNLLEKSKNSPTAICVFRPSSIYGVNDKGSMSSLIRLSKKGFFLMLGKGKNKKSLLYLSDIVKIVHKYIQNENDFNGHIFNVSSGNYSYQEIVETINTVFSLRPLKLFVPGWFCEYIAPKFRLLKKINSAYETKIISDAKIKELLCSLEGYPLKDGLQDAKYYYD